MAHKIVRRYFPVFYEESNGTLVFAGSGHGRNEREALTEFKKKLRVKPAETWGRQKSVTPYF